MRLKLPKLKGLDHPCVRNMFLKNAAAFAIAVVAGGAFALFADMKAVVFPAAFVALYFAANAAAVAWNAARGKYMVVRAAAVAHEESMNAIRQKRTVYRFIPVDEAGDYLDEQGNFDIFLDITGKKKIARLNVFIGRVYLLVFFVDGSGQLNERTLAAVYAE